MLILAIDTAGPNCATAVARRADDGVTILDRLEERIGTGHAERLMPMIDEVLAAAGASYADLNRIAAATGPGSFTGVRIGIAAARGLSLALSVPAIGVGVLDAMIHEARAADALSPDAVLVACLDARRGEIYAKLSGEPDARRTDAAALAARLAERDGPLVLVGSAADAVAAEPVLAGRSLEILSRADCADVGALARLGFEAAAGPAPSPLYLRPPDAKPQTGRAVARL